MAGFTKTPNLNIQKNTCYLFCNLICKITSLTLQNEAEVFSSPTPWPPCVVPNFHIKSTDYLFSTVDNAHCMFSPESGKKLQDSTALQLELCLSAQPHAKFWTSSLPHGNMHLGNGHPLTPPLPAAIRWTVTKKLPHGPTLSREPHVPTIWWIERSVWMGIILQIFSNWKPREAEPTPATISCNCR